MGSILNKSDRIRLLAATKEIMLVLNYFLNAACTDQFIEGRHTKKNEKKRVIASKRFISTYPLQNGAVLSLFS